MPKVLNKNKSLIFNDLLKLCYKEITIGLEK